MMIAGINHFAGIAAMKVTLLIILSSVAISLALISPFPKQYLLDDDYVLLDYQNVSTPFSNFSYKGLVSSTNRSYTAFVAVLPSGISSQFSFELPKGKLRCFSTTNSLFLYRWMWYSQPHISYVTRAQLQLLY